VLITAFDYIVDPFSVHPLYTNATLPYCNGHWYTVCLQI